MSPAEAPFANIQLQNIMLKIDSTTVLNLFPEDVVFNDEININGEGKSTVESTKGVTLAELTFKNGKLDGCCIFNDENGDKIAEIYFKEGVADGLYFEYENNSISRMRIYEKGKESCELRSHLKNSKFLEEVRDSKVISVCQYNEEYKKDGLCTFFENDNPSSVVRFENGVEREKKCEFDNGRMTEFDKEGRVIYRGGYKGGAIEGFIHYGNGFCYESLNGKVNRINIVKNGMKRGYQLIGDVLKEYDADGKLVYEGGFEVSSENGYVWSGKGSEYLKDGIIVYGEFMNGKRVKTICEICKEELTEYDNDNHTVYIGEYSKENLKRSGKGKLFIYGGDSLKEVYYCQNGERIWKIMEFKDKTMTEYNENGEMTYQGGFRGDVRSGFVREGDEGFEYAEGLVYKGGWRNGMYNGKGRSYKNKKVYYNGTWKDGVPHGKGVLNNDDGNLKYDGEWKNGCIIVEKGTGFNYISEKMCHFYENGLKKYEGDMKHRTPHGRGVYYDQQGNKKYEGQWVDGEIHVKGSKWFCYENEEIKVRRIKTVIEKRVEIMMRLSILSVLILLVVGIVSVWFSKFFMKELVLSGGNDIFGDYEISGYRNVKSIVVKKDSFKYLNSLTIKNNPKLEIIILEDGDDGDSEKKTYHAPFENVKSVIITSKIEFDFIIKIFLNSPHSQQEIGHSMKQPH